MKKLLLVVTLSLVLSFGLSSVSFQDTYAAQPNTAPISTSCDASLLTLPAWYNGIRGVVGGECEVVIRDIKQLVTRIIINIIEVILQLVGYVATIFIIIGGYRYLLSSGDPSKLTAAKTTILNAVIGLVISLFSVAIINVVAGAL